MRKKSILVKSIVCSSFYLILWSLTFFTAYIGDSVFHPFLMAIVFGIICGTVIAIITVCAELKRTILARVFGVLSVVATDFLLSMSGVPHKIILYKYRNDTFVQETGRLTVNETIVFGWSNFVPLMKKAKENLLLTA
ncbi:MAG: hypothetical protein LBD23_15140 [Oscillospiraceae bacterium]|jgi:predicted PurR-regulated permease PerM|nr:hypothetical protein [Oscillospiraceae bacterium]